MNDWHLDARLARGQVAERLVQAEHGRLAARARENPPPFRLQLRLNFELSLGRGGHPAPAVE